MLLYRDNRKIKQFFIFVVVYIIRLFIIITYICIICRKCNKFAGCSCTSSFLQQLELLVILRSIRFAGNSKLRCLVPEANALPDGNFWLSVIRVDDGGATDPFREMGVQRNSTETQESEPLPGLD